MPRKKQLVWKKRVFRCFLNKKRQQCAERTKTGRDFCERCCIIFCRKACIFRKWVLNCQKRRRCVHDSDQAADAALSADPVEQLPEGRTDELRPSGLKQSIVIPLRQSAGSGFLIFWRKTGTAVGKTWRQRKTRRPFKAASLFLEPLIQRSDHSRPRW